LACALGGLALKDTFLTRERFMEMKLDGTLPFGQVPLLLVDGQPLAQSDSQYVALFGVLQGCISHPIHRSIPKVALRWKVVWTLPRRCTAGMLSQ
jgi:hypothetical protein